MKEADLKRKETHQFQEVLKKDLRTEKERRAQNEAALFQMVFLQHRRILALESALEPFSYMPPWGTVMAEWLEKARRSAEDGFAYREAVEALKERVKIAGLEFP